MATKLFFLFFIVLEVVLSQKEDNFGEGENVSKEEDLQCDTAEIELKCPASQYLPKAMASRSPFFGDSVALSCTNMGKKIYEDEDALSVTFVSSDGGLTLNAHCPDTHSIISGFSFCLEESRVRVASLNCVSLIDTCIVEDTFNKTSDDQGYHQMVNCGDSSTIQGMHMMDAGDMVTRVVFDCAKVSCGEEGI